MASHTALLATPDRATEAGSIIRFRLRLPPTDEIAPPALTDAGVLVPLRCDARATTVAAALDAVFARAARKFPALADATCLTAVETVMLSPQGGAWQGSRAPFTLDVAVNGDDALECYADGATDISIAVTAWRPAWRAVLKAAPAAATEPVPATNGGSSPPPPPPPVAPRSPVPTPREKMLFGDRATPTQQDATAATHTAAVGVGRQLDFSAEVAAATSEGRHLHEQAGMSGSGMAAYVARPGSASPKDRSPVAQRPTYTLHQPAPMGTLAERDGSGSSGRSLSNGPSAEPAPRQPAVYRPQPPTIDRARSGSATVRRNAPWVRVGAAPPAVAVVVPPGSQSARRPSERPDQDESPTRAGAPPLHPQTLAGSPPNTATQFRLQLVVSDFTDEEDQARQVGLDAEAAARCAVVDMRRHTIATAFADGLSAIEAAAEIHHDSQLAAHVDWLFAQLWPRFSRVCEIIAHDDQERAEAAAAKAAADSAAQDALYQSHLRLGGAHSDEPPPAHLLRAHERASPVDTTTTAQTSSGRAHTPPAMQRLRNDRRVTYINNLEDTRRRSLEVEWQEEFNAIHEHFLHHAQREAVRHDARFSEAARRVVAEEAAARAAKAAAGSISTSPPPSPISSRKCSARWAVAAGGAAASAARTCATTWKSRSKKRLPANRPKSKCRPLAHAKAAMAPARKMARIRSTAPPAAGRAGSGRAKASSR